jgi:single-strand DNA-binding protein
MLNQTVLVGRLVQNSELQEEKGKKVAIVKLAVPRNYKNADGVYDIDYIDCVLWTGVAENTSEYCHKGDILGVKGRIECLEDNMIIVAEKVTFLSSKGEK